MTPSRREALILGAAGIAAAAAGFLAGPLVLRSTGEERAAGTLSGDAIQGSTALVDLAGKPRRLSEWQDRILVCNFWATWCAPCREEIPLLMSAWQKYRNLGVEIVGIAIDNASKVAEYAVSLNISYQILLAEADGIELMHRLGNTSGALPYTVVSDRRGSVVHRRLGALRQKDLDAMLGPLTQT
jgi:thiol-disulfide isomerase/thioredoxin